MQFSCDYGSKPTKAFRFLLLFQFKTQLACNRAAAIGAKPIQLAVQVEEPKAELGRREECARTSPLKGNDDQIGVIILRAKSENLQTSFAVTYAVFLSTNPRLAYIRAAIVKLVRGPDIRLGDIIVSYPHGRTGGVVQ